MFKIKIESLMKIVHFADNTVKTVPPEKVQDDYSNSDETVEESEQSDIESDYNSPLVKRKRGKPKIRTITVDDDGLNGTYNFI